jgi:hypothetical protein
VEQGLTRTAQVLLKLPKWIVESRLLNRASPATLFETVIAIGIGSVVAAAVMGFNLSSARNPAATDGLP